MGAGGPGEVWSRNTVLSDGTVGQSNAIFLISTVGDDLEGSKFDMKYACMYIENRLRISQMS